MARATNQNCRYLNDMAESMFGTSIFEDPDAVEVKIGKPVD